MSAIKLEEIVPAEDYLLVEKIEETETSSGLVILQSLLNLVKIVRHNLEDFAEGSIGILNLPPEHDLQNGQFLTHKANLIGTANIKE